MSAEDDERFWAQIRGDAKRTVLCEQHRLDEIQAVVEERGLGDILTVRGSAFCSEGTLLIIDEGGIEALCRQIVQRPFPRLRPGGPIL